MLSTKSSESDKNQMGRNLWLDVLRGIAIFGVVAVHVISNSKDVTYAITGGKYMS